MSDLNFYGGSPFRIKRPLITTSGIVSEVDSTIKGHLDELNSLLGKRIFAPAAAQSKKRSALATGGGASTTPDFMALLAKSLTPKYVPPTAAIAGMQAAWRTRSTQRPNPQKIQRSQI